MACYTLSKCIANSIIVGKKYITDLLMVFTQESNPYKIAVDKTKRILNIYEEIGQENEFFANWLALMSFQPANFEFINIDVENIVNDEELFLKVCSSTKSQQKLIVHSHECWETFCYDGPSIIVYNHVPVRILDRDEAIEDLKNYNSSTIHAYSSIIATNHSNINNSKNK